MEGTWEITFSTNVAGGVEHLWAKMELQLSLTPYTKINSKWIMNLSANSEAIKLTQTVEGKLWDLGKEFIDLLPKHNP